MAKLILMCGIPGSGKSTYAREHIHNCEYISRDEIRFSLLDADPEADYFSKEGEVVRIWEESIVKALNENKTVIADATHLSKKNRAILFKYIDANCEVDYTTMIYAFEVPLDECIARNNKREGRAVVPEHVIRDMYNRYQRPSYKEHDSINCIIVINENLEATVV